MRVEYTEIHEGGVTLTLAWPKNDGSNSNQYLIGIDGLKVYQADQSSLLGICGDWEFEAVLDCLNKARSYILSGMPGNKKTFNAEGMLGVSLVISRKYDQPEKYRLKFSFEDYAQMPLAKQANGGSFRNEVFAIYASPTEVRSLSDAVERYFDGDVQVSNLAESSKEDWLYPRQVSVDAHQDPYVASVFANEAVRVIEEQEWLPDGLVTLWKKLLSESIINPDLVYTCKECNGRFVPDVHWKKTCFGCYVGRDPTALSTAELFKIRLDSWLGQVEGDEDHAEDENLHSEIYL